MKPNEFTPLKIDPRLNMLPLHISLINTEDAFFKLRDDWNKLLQQSNESYIFHSWEWLYTWWEIFANDNDELVILTIYHNEVLVGIAPFYIQQTAFFKTLKSLGEGEPKHESITTHYQDIICYNHSKKTVVKSVAEYLSDHSRWDYCEFSFVLDDSCLSSLIEELQPVLMMKKSLGHRYRVNLKRSFENVYNNLGKSARKAFRSKRNRMQKMGELSLESLNLSESLEESLNIHVDFHTHRQKALGHAGAFLEPRFKRFHRTLIERLESTSSIHTAQIRVLNISSEPIACTLNYISNEAKDPTVYAYSAGFKSSDDARLSPMFVFDLLEFEHLIDNGISYYDFLSTDEGATYKSTYKADQDAVSRVHWFEKTPIAFVAYTYFKTRLGLSYIKQYIIRYKTKFA